MLSKNAQIGEDAGSEARRSFGLAPDHPVDDLVRVLERSTDLAVFFAPLGTQGPAGALDVQRDQPFALVNSTQDPVRMRFTLAHELGHHVLGHRAVLDEQISFADRDPREVQANYFAAAFLMPAAAIEATVARRGYPEISFPLVCELADEFGVSPAAIANRLETIGRIDAAAKTSFDAAISEGAHYGRYRALLNDTIGGLRDRFRTPLNMERNTISAILGDRLPRDVGARVLRIDESGVDQLLSSAENS